MSVNQVTSGKEFIDMTQNAVVNATENLISDVSLPAHHYGAFYENPVFWVAVSFILVVLLLARPVGKIAKQLLQNRVDAIIKRIEDAANLKDDAQKLLVEYERKFVNAEAEANGILQKSKKEIELLKKESLEKLKLEMAIKEKEAEERLKASQAEVMNEIVSMTSNVTIEVLKKVLSENLNAKMQDELIEKSINSIAKLPKAE